MKISATGSKLLLFHFFFFSHVQPVHCCKALLTGASAKRNTCKCSNSHVGMWGVGGAAVTVGVEVLEGAVELVMGAAL